MNLFHRRGRHADSLGKDDRTSLVVTVPASPLYASPVTAGAVRADRQDRAQKAPDAPAQAFAPPWSGDAQWTPPSSPPVSAPVPQPQPRDDGTIPQAPVVLPAVIFEAIGGSERTARACGHCGALNVFGDSRWQADALLIWSCLDCQAKPWWDSPAPVVLRGDAAEYRLACAASVVAGDPLPGRRLYLSVPWHSPVRVVA